MSGRTGNQQRVTKKSRVLMQPKYNKKTPQSPDEKMQRLDVKTSEAIKSSGGSNVLQAKYYKEVASVAVNAMEETQNPLLYFAQPHIMMKNTEQWRQSMIFVIRFLKKYNMQTTLDCIRTEAPGLVKQFNLKQGTKNHIIFDELMGVSEDLGTLDFKYRVNTFFLENKIEIPENPYAFRMDDSASVDKNPSKPAQKGRRSRPF